LSVGHKNDKSALLQRSSTNSEPLKGRNKAEQKEIKGEEKGPLVRTQERKEIKGS
jgi:hypothetical protein